MEQRDNAKKMAIRSNYESDWQVYRKLRNYVTKLNIKKKKIHHEKVFNNIKARRQEMMEYFTQYHGQKI